MKKNKNFPILTFKLALLLILLVNLSITSHSNVIGQIHVHLFHKKSLPKEFILKGRFETLKPKLQTLENSDYTLKCTEGRLRLLTKNNKSLLSASSLLIEAMPKVTIIFANTKRSYPGILKISTNKNCELNFENFVSPLDYVKIVISSETTADWPLEALKAQSILTQTRIASYKTNKIIYDSTQDEAYLGLEHVHKNAERSAKETWGKVLLTHNPQNGRNELLKVYYHATCAGQISGENYFKGSQSSKLENVKCNFCRQSPFFDYHEGKIAKAKFQKVFGKSLPKIIETDASGRALLIRLSDGKNISGYEFWLKLGQHFGWDKAPGTNFQILESNGFVVIKSRGAGHGVGLCQWGAREMALQGKTHKEILRFYFPQAFLRQK